jgi:hypothetical protein
MEDAVLIDLAIPDRPRVGRGEFVRPISGVGPGAVAAAAQSRARITLRICSWVRRTFAWAWAF